MSDFTASELRARIQKQVFSRDAAGRPTNCDQCGAELDAFNRSRETRHQNCRPQLRTATSDRIVSAEYAKHGKFPSLLQSAEDERREELNRDAREQSRLDADEEPRFNPWVDGRNPDGIGESYAERNA